MAAVKAGTKWEPNHNPNSNTPITQSGFTSISDRMIELFLDDRCRKKILLYLNSQRSSDALRWFDDNGLHLYRKLFDPLSKNFLFVQGVLPPKMDLDEA
jgi:hypothetical protein